MKQFLAHLFLPHHSNNHRAKMLHHSSIFFLIAFFFFGQFLITNVKKQYPAVLGTSIDISTTTLLDLTNKDRAQEHLPPVRLNTTLSQAAEMKADYMFEKNFWAHNGPDGTTPWYFFKKVGYTYVYAGENLARGFTDSKEVNEAWMNSPTHRENILSPNYQEIGFAIKKGKLLGEDTTLVVELFGSRDVLPVATAPQEPLTQSNGSVLPAATAPANSAITSAYNYAVKTTSLFSSRGVTQGIGIFILAAFMFVLLLDILIVQRKKIVRFVGHNTDHMLFFGAMLVIMILSMKGLVL